MVSDQQEPVDELICFVQRRICAAVRILAVLDGRSEEMAGSVDDADSGVWDERDCGVCSGLANLWTRVHVYSERAERNNAELARSRTGLAGSSGTQYGECLARLFALSGGRLLDFVMAFVAKEDLFEDLKSEAPTRD